MLSWFCVLWLHSDADEKAGLKPARWSGTGRSTDAMTQLTYKIPGGMLTMNHPDAAREGGGELIVLLWNRIVTRAHACGVSQVEGSYIVKHRVEGVREREIRGVWLSETRHRAHGRGTFVSAQSERFPEYRKAGENVCMHPTVLFTLISKNEPKQRHHGVYQEHCAESHGRGPARSDQSCRCAYTST